MSNEFYTQYCIELKQEDTPCSLYLIYEMWNEEVLREIPDPNHKLVHALMDTGAIDYIHELDVLYQGATLRIQSDRGGLPAAITLLDWMAQEGVFEDRPFTFLWITHTENPEPDGVDGGYVTVQRNEPIDQVSLSLLLEIRGL